MNYNKLYDFVSQLLNSPALKSLNSAEREEGVITIIKSKEDKLKATFVSAEYYPGESWETLKAEMLKNLGQEISVLIRPKLQNILFYTVQKLSGFPQPDTSSREKIQELVLKMITRHTSRRDYGKIVGFIDANILSSYTRSLYNNKKFIYRGLNRFDSRPLKTHEEALDYIHTALLLLPLYNISLPKKLLTPNGSNALVTLKELADDSDLSKNFIMKIKDIITKELPQISGDFLETLEKTFYVENNAEKPFNSNLLNIFYDFAVSWNSEQKDKGAESFSLSWFNVARVNYKFYGYDFNIIDELYKTTIEEDL